MNNFYVFITAVTPLYKESVVFEMLRRGYTICAIDTNETKNEMVNDSEVSALIYFEARHPIRGQEITGEITEDVMSVLKQIKAKYHSIICARTSGVSWYGANFKFPEETK